TETPVTPTTTSLTVSAVICGEIAVTPTSGSCGGRDASLEGQSIPSTVTTSAGPETGAVALSNGQGSQSVTVPAGDVTVCVEAPANVVASYNQATIPFAGAPAYC